MIAIAAASFILFSLVEIGIEEPHQITYRRYKYTSCRDALAHLPPIIGEARIKIKINSQTINRAGIYTIRYFALVDDSESSIVLPEISWSDMTEAERLRWAQIVANLRFHEEGHFTIANRFLKTTNAQIQPLQSSLLDAIRKLLAEKEREIYADFSRVEDAYDTETAHGSRQSDADGSLKGADIVYGCE